MDNCEDGATSSLHPTSQDPPPALLKPLNEECLAAEPFKCSIILGLRSLHAWRQKGELQREIQLSDAVAQGMYLVKVTINDRGFTVQVNSGR
jgi:hypothetical protein